jgi:hypothetical protein
MSIWIRQSSGLASLIEYIDNLTPNQLPLATNQIPVVNNATKDTMSAIGLVNGVTYTLTPPVPGLNNALTYEITPVSSGIARVTINEGANVYQAWFYLLAGVTSVIQIYSNFEVDTADLFFSSAVAGNTYTVEGALAPLSSMLPNSGTSGSVVVSEFLPTYLRVVAFAFDFSSATWNSPLPISAGSKVIRSNIEVLTVFSGGTTFTLGNSTTPDLLQDTTDNNPTIIGNNPAINNIAWGGLTLPVLLTIAGGPGSGSGQVIYEYIPMEFL